MKKFLLYVFSLLLCASTSAQTFTFDKLSFSVISEENREVEVTDSENSGDTILVPETVVYENRTYQVSQIGSFAFSWTEARYIELPKSVKIIKNDAFSAAKSLLEITIPDQVVSIGMTAFEDCRSLERISFGANMSDIGYRAFVGCTALKEINVSQQNKHYTSQNGVLFNKAMTFLIQYPAGRTDSVYILPVSVNKVGESAFARNAYLKTVHLGAEVDSLGDSAFDRCSALESIYIPEKIQEIPGWAFSKCRSLRKVYLGEGVKTISWKSFEYCTALEEICCNSLQKPFLNDEAFTGVNQNIPVYVRSELMEQFQSDINWSYFSDFRDVSTSSVLDLTDDNCALQIIQGGLLNSQEQPLVIYDFAGRMVYSGSDMNVWLSNGVYLIKYNGKMKKITFK